MEITQEQYARIRDSLPVQRDSVCGGTGLYSGTGWVDVGGRRDAPTSFTV
jgi:hypothetical protein